VGAALAGRGGVVALSGHLGAGKTTFVKGLAEGLKVAPARDVVSPTFLRVVRFEGPTPLVHVDAYRMRGPADFVELGLDEETAAGACVAVEWPEIVASALPDDRLLVELEHVDERTRRVRVCAGGPDSATALAALDVQAAGGGKSP
jgi:tRNA threonylcarbamoyladenosine biosynthesis protein TsaE